MKFEDLIQLEYLLAFATLILPGFLVMKFIRLKVPNKDFLLKDMLFEALVYSLLNLAIFGWAPYLLLYYEYIVLSIIAFIFTLTISPVLLTFCYIKIIDSKWFSKYFDIQMPTAWDWYFSQRKNAILLIRMVDDTEVIGYFGNNSYATSYPNEGSIYMEKIYRKSSDSQSIEEIPSSQGMLITKDKYKTIEFYKTEGNN